jgi:hypothetical protein
MDNFIEQIVVKKADGADILKRAVFFAGGMGACIFFWALSASVFLLNPMISMIFVLISFGLVWLAWQLIQTTFIEYEYIIVNNELDVDKIIARKKRKRLVTIKLDKAEEWGEYTEGKSIEAAVTVQAHDFRYKNLWYILVQHDRFGKTVVYFSPRRAVLEVMNKAVPYSLRKQELKEREPENEEIAENQEKSNDGQEKEGSEDL